MGDAIYRCKECENLHLCPALEDANEIFPGYGEFSPYRIPQGMFTT
jgi:hypothetical protein